MVPKRNKTCHTEAPLYTIAHSRGSAQIPPLEWTHNLQPLGIPATAGSWCALLGIVLSCRELPCPGRGLSWPSLADAGKQRHHLASNWDSSEGPPYAELPRGPASLPAHTGLPHLLTGVASEGNSPTNLPHTFLQLWRRPASDIQLLLFI